jgi:hypothetical protein
MPCSLRLSALVCASKAGNVGSKSIGVRAVNQSLSDALFIVFHYAILSGEAFL